MSGMFTDFDGSENSTGALFFTIEPIPFTSPSTTTTTSYSAEPTRNGLEELFLPVDPQLLPPPGSFVNSSEVSLSRTECSCGHELQLQPPNSTQPPHPKRSSTKSQSSSQVTRDSRVLTKEEARRLKNRESAAKSRRRALEDTLAELQQRHEFLRNELQRLLEQRGLVEATGATGVR